VPAWQPQGTGYQPEGKRGGPRFRTQHARAEKRDRDPDVQNPRRAR
jgi:hypothetical protein